MGKGPGGSSGGSTVTQSNQPPPQFMQAYQSLVNNAQSTASQPYRPYTGNLVADFNPTQGQAFDSILGSANTAQPYINQASGIFQNNANSNLWGQLPQLNAADINQYQSPYTQDVTQATEAQFANLNAQQQSGLIGNAINSGAFGGDRAAVAQGILGGQQAASEAPVLAGIQQQGYNTALSTAQQQQQQQLSALEAQGWLGSQSAFGLGQLGGESQNLAESGAQSILGVGNMQQQLAQEQLNVPFYQYQAQQAYPFQTQNWLANIVEGTGSLSGGTAQTTTPGPSTASQVGGGALLGTGILGMTGAFPGNGGSGWLAGLGGLFGGGGGSEILARDGGRIHRYRTGGGILPSGIHVERRDDGGGILPILADIERGWVPRASGTSAKGAGPPRPPGSSPLSNPVNQAASTLGALRGIMPGNGAVRGIMPNNGAANAGLSGPLEVAPEDIVGNEASDVGVGTTFGEAGTSMAGDALASGASDAAGMSFADLLGAGMSAIRRGGVVRERGGGILPPGRYLPRRDSGGPISHDNTWMQWPGRIIGGAIGSFFEPGLGTMIGSEAGGDAGSMVGDLFGGNWKGMEGDFIDSLQKPQQLEQMGMQFAQDPIGSLSKIKLARGGAALRYDDGGEVDDDPSYALEASPDYTGPSDGILPGPPQPKPPVPEQQQDGGNYGYEPRQPSGRGADIRRMAPWEALAMAGAGILGSRSPYPGVAIGEGAMRGLQAYGQARGEADKEDEREEEQADRAAYNKANLKREGAQFSATLDQKKTQLKQMGAQHDEQMQIERDKLPIEQQRADAATQTAQETAAWRRAEAGRGYWEPSAPILGDDGKPKTDATGAPLYTWTDRYTGNTRQGPYDPTNAGRGGKGQTASQWKYNAWLAAHPGDEQGALDFVGGHKQMAEPDIIKTAAGMASKEWNDLYKSGDRPAPADAPGWLSGRAKEIADQLRAGRQAQPPGGAADPLGIR